jgi:hypothetical protein
MSTSTATEFTTTTLSTKQISTVSRSVREPDGRLCTACFTLEVDLKPGMHNFAGTPSLLAVVKLDWTIPPGGSNTLKDGLIRQPWVVPGQAVQQVKKRKRPRAVTGSRV